MCYCCLFVFVLLCKLSFCLCINASVCVALRCSSGFAFCVHLMLLCSVCSCCYIVLCVVPACFVVVVVL